MQLILTLRHVHNILAMPRIVSRNPIDRFLYPQATFIIHKAGVDVNALHPGKLSAILPGAGPGAIAQRVANGTKRPTGNAGWPVALTRCPDALLQRNFDDQL